MIIIIIIISGCCDDAKTTSDVVCSTNKPVWFAVQTSLCGLQYKQALQPQLSVLLSWFPGLVPIRIGALTVDPVTGVLAPVVGARLDMSRKTIVPVTVSNWTTTCDHLGTVQVGTVPAASLTHVLTTFLFVF